MRTLIFDSSVTGHHLEYLHHYYMEAIGHTDEEYVSMVKTGAWLAQTCKLDPRKDFIRHYDVTGKLCPLYYVKHEKAWEGFLSQIEKKLEQN